MSNGKTGSGPRPPKRANGEGTVRWDGNRQRWVGRVTIGFTADGRPIRPSFVEKKKADAERRMKEAKAAVEVGLLPPDMRLTVGTYLQTWLASLPSSGRVSESTIATYETRVRLYLMPAVGHIKLRALTPFHVAQLLMDMRERGLATETQRLTRAVLRRALRVAEQQGLVERNVAAIADGPRTISSKEKRSLTEAQARSFLDTADASPERMPSTPGPIPTATQRLSAAVHVTLCLGLRRGEALGLRWDDLDFDSDKPILHIRQQLVRRPKGKGLGLMPLKTGKSRRSLRLPDQMTALLRRHRADQNIERLAAGPNWRNELGLVFTTAFGTPVDPRNFNRAVSQVATRAGLGHWSPHELRHSAASLLLDEKVSLEVVSETLGHSSIRITKDVYGHILDRARDEPASAMSRVLWGHE